MSLKSVATIFGLVLLIVCPFLISSPYYLHLVVTITIYAILVLGLDIVFGYTGEVSIGHAALFGIGAYVAGILSMKFGIGLWLSLPLAIVVTAIFGLMLALPALRVTGPYLAMVTLAFGTIVQILINETTDLTNGPLGIKLNTPLILAHGTYETPEFQRQTRDFYAAVKAAGKPAELIVGEGYNHFEMLETLANPYGLLGRAMLAQMRLSTAA